MAVGIHRDCCGIQGLKCLLETHSFYLLQVQCSGHHAGCRGFACTRKTTNRECAEGMSAPCSASQKLFAYLETECFLPATPLWKLIWWTPSCECPWHCPAQQLALSQVGTCLQRLLASSASLDQQRQQRAADTYGYMIKRRQRMSLCRRGLCACCPSAEPQDHGVCHYKQRAGSRLSRQMFRSEVLHLPQAVE